MLLMDCPDFHVLRHEIYRRTLYQAGLLLARIFSLFFEWGMDMIPQSRQQIIAFTFLLRYDKV
jgi:hypothetical protein